VCSLIVISGAPCAGKSTVAAELRRLLGWPLLAKDAFKETLFDTLGAGDRDWSKRLSGASYALLLQAAEELLMTRRSCIVEGNFRWLENEARFVALRRAQPQARWLQIFCDAPTELLIARYGERVSQGARHPGHVDAEAAAEVEAELRRLRVPLPLAGTTTLSFDSSNNDPRAVLDIARQVRTWANTPESE
jgi:predicted kinase